MALSEPVPLNAGDAEAADPDCAADMDPELEGVSDTTAEALLVKALLTESAPVVLTVSDAVADTETDTMPVRVGTAEKVLANELEADFDAALEAVGTTEPDAHAVEDLLEDGEPDSRADCVATDAVASFDASAEKLVDGEAEASAVLLLHALAHGEAETPTVLLPRALSLGVGLELTQLLPERMPETDAPKEGLTVLLPLSVDELVSDALPDAVALTEAHAETLGDRESGAEAVGKVLKVAETVCDSVPVTVGEAFLEVVTDPEGEAVVEGEPDGDGGDVA